MISEVTLAKKFTSFWNQLLPNSNNFMRVINRGLVENLKGNYELSENTRPINVSLINVLSFKLLKSVVTKEISFDNCLRESFFTSDDFNKVLTASIFYLKRFSNKSGLLLPLNKDELNEVIHLFVCLYKRYESFFSVIEISPIFQGCGFVNKSEGDIFFTDTLVELKSGKRNFSITDIRQLLVYCTLNHYANKEKRQIKNIELFNPRMGLAYKTSLIDLSENLGSLAHEDLLFEIHSFITESNLIETL